MQTPEILRPPEFYNPELDLMQDEAVKVLEQARLDGIQSAYINVTMGGGKTRIMAREAANFLEENPDARVLYLCHDEKILEQAMDEFGNHIDPTIEIGSIMNGSLDHESQVTMASFHQLNRGLQLGHSDTKLYELIPEDHYDYVIVDESHHGPAPTYKQVIEHFKPQFLRGMTGTANRLDRQDIGEIFGPEIFFVSLEEAISRGFVSGLDYRVFSEEMEHATGADAEGLTFKEYVDKQFIKRDANEIVRIIKEQTADMENPRSLVFCRSKKEADDYAELIGGDAAALHSGLDPRERERILEQYRAGKINTLVAVDMMNEGVDVRDINVVAFVRSPQSEAISLQQLGRGLRRAIGKDSLRVLDFVAGYDRVRYIAALQERLQDAAKAFPRHSGEAVPFKFSLSRETKRAFRQMEHLRRKLHRGDDNIEAIENLFGSKLSEKQRLSRKQEELLIRGIRKGDTDAARKLLTYRARSIYSAIRNIPEENGLTTADYFQIGAQTVIEAALNQDNVVDKNYLIRLNSSIKTRVGQAVRDSGESVQSNNMTTFKHAKDEGVQVPDHSDLVHNRLETTAALIELGDALEAISYRERRVIEHRYGLNGEEQKTLREVGKIFNVTSERIRGIENTALKKMQTYMVNKPFFRPERFEVTAQTPHEYAVARHLGYPAVLNSEGSKDLAAHAKGGLKDTVRRHAANRAAHQEPTKVVPRRPRRNMLSDEETQRYDAIADGLTPQLITKELLRTIVNQRKLERQRAMDYGDANPVDRQNELEQIDRALGRLAQWRVAVTNTYVRRTDKTLKENQGNHQAVATLATGLGLDEDDFAELLTLEDDLYLFEDILPRELGDELLSDPDDDFDLY